MWTHLLGVYGCFVELNVKRIGANLILRTGIVLGSVVVLIGIAVAWLLLSRASAAEPLALTPTTSAAIIDGLQRLRASPSGAPGLEVTVITRGIAKSFYVGNADISSQIPVSSSTRFPIGSLSKMFVAIGILKLESEHKLSLDEPLSRFFRIPMIENVSVRDLMMHRSGIPNYLDAAIADGEARRGTSSLAIVRDSLKKGLAFEPGTQFLYSNTNFILLGKIIEQLSHRSLASFESEIIFRPCRMVHTAPLREQLSAADAIGYEHSAVRARHLDPSWLYAAGDVTSTGQDLASFDYALMTNKFRIPNLLGRIQASAMSTGHGYSYGLGFSVASLGALTAVGHHGGMPGFAAENEIFPKRHMAIIVLGNSSYFNTSRANRAVLSVLCPIALISSAIGQVFHMN